MLKIEDFKHLATATGKNCVSIYIPTHRMGEEVKASKDQKVYKNQIKKVRNQLERLSLNKKEVNQIMKGPENLLNDTGFWNEQSDGLAVFSNGDLFEYYSEPVSFMPFSFVSNHFYLKSLIPSLNETGKYYLLALSLNEVAFYEAGFNYIQEIEISDLIPSSMEDSFFEEDKEKSLQFRTQQNSSNSGQSMYHGHHKKDDRKKMIYNYFKQIDAGIFPLLKNEKAPLLIAAVDFLFPLYQEANSYKYLHQNYIRGNPFDDDPVLLHEKSISIAEVLLNKEKEAKKKAISSAKPVVESSIELEKILPAAFEGRIDTLFIKNLETIYGVFHLKDHKIIFQNQEQPPQNCLLNTLAIQTIMKGGKVYILDAQEMPLKESSVNALFRF